MAEIRKFDPEAGNAIAQALRAAMGEPVRPNQPGRRPEQAPAPAEPHVVTFSVRTTVVPEERDSD